MASTTPLLADDVETGKGIKSQISRLDTKSKKAELDAELALGKMSKEEMIMLVANPNNWPFVALLCVCLFVLVRIVFFELIKSPGHLPGYVMVTLIICFLGLLGATYNTFLAQQMQELIDRFRALNKELKALNKKLGAQVDRLEEDVQKLSTISDTLQSELDQFQALKDQMQAFAAEQQGDFKEVFKQAMGVFDGMKKTAKQQSVQILQQLAQSIEFMDNEEGISETEWKRFCSRVPKEYKEKFAGTTFQSMAKDGKVDFEAMNNLIREMTKDA